MVMFFLSLVFALLVSLVRTGIDILVFFLVVRIIARARQRPRWIVYLNRVGTELVDGAMRAVDRSLVFLTGARWREEARLVLSILVLWVFRFSLG